MSTIQSAESGHLTLAGFRVYYEVFGDSSLPPVLLLPAWQIVYRRVWKMQVPFLARHFRVITYDSPGNGLAERTTDRRAFEYDRIVDQAVGILDHLGIERASVVGFSRGSNYGIALAARYPERVERLALIANGVAPDVLPTARPDFWQERETYEGWEKYNAHYWHADYRGWLEFYFSELFPEPHSTKGTDDGVAWGLETTPDILAQSIASLDLYPRMPTAEAIDRVRCPVLILHGDEDRRDPIEFSYALAQARPDWQLVVLEGCGHAPLLRDPARVNLLLREFLQRDLLTTTNAESRDARA